MESVESLAYVLALTRLRGTSLSRPDRVSELLLCGDAEEAYSRARASDGTLGVDVADGVRRARDDIERWVECGYGIVSVLSSRYPSRVREIREAPALLYYEGALLSDDDAVCVVGSRRASRGGLREADAAARALVAHGYTVLAGLAAGIDTAAHRAAVERGGRTVAVMGTGLDQTYPAANIGLRREIVSSGGLVLTQFEPGTRTTRRNFPMRNAVMSGYGLASFIVEAGETSGTRAQTRLALGHGRAVILAPRVATSTSWGQEAAHTHAAVVAASSSELLGYVDSLRARRESTARQMAALLW